MKRVLLCGISLLCALNMVAQPKGHKPRELVSDSYHRNSVSIVVVEHSDIYDSDVDQAVRAIKYGDKFDKNNIPTKSVKVSTSREMVPNVAAINLSVASSKIGHEVVQYWFDSENRGHMSGQLIEKRGRFNANDQDVMNAQSVKIGSSLLSDDGYSLINSSYVLAMDCSQIRDTIVTTSKFINFEMVEVEEPAIAAVVTLCAYKVDFSEDVQNKFYERCWIDNLTPSSKVSERRREFMNMMIPVVPLQSVRVAKVVKIEDGGLDKAISDGYFEALHTLENSIEEWRVKVAILGTKPVSAKVGTKEGLGNGDRYMAYQTVRKTIDGEEVTYSKKMGYVRATTIANNSTNADGRSSMSQFYQISHLKNVQRGQLLQQSNDLGMDLSLGGQVGGLSSFVVGVDYLTKINSNGTARYATMDIGYGLISGKRLSEKFDPTDDVVSAGFSFISVDAGCGYGLRPGIRIIEFVPKLAVGCDWMIVNNEFIDDSDYDDSSSSWMDDMALYAKAGAKINITVAYPFQIFAGVSYSLIFLEGNKYNYYNDQFRSAGMGRTGGLGFSAGVKYTF